MHGQLHKRKSFDNKYNTLAVRLVLRPSSTGMSGAQASQPSIKHPNALFNLFNTYDQYQSEHTAVVQAGGLQQTRQAVRCLGCQIGASS